MHAIRAAAAGCISQTRLNKTNPTGNSSVVAEPLAWLHGYGRKARRARWPRGGGGERNPVGRESYEVASCIHCTMRAAQTQADLVVQGEQRPRGVADLREGHLHAPELALVPQPILADRLQLRIEPLLLIRSSRLLECFTICTARRWSGTRLAAVESGGRPPRGGGTWRSCIVVWLMQHVVELGWGTHSCGRRRRAAW